MSNKAKKTLNLIILALVSPLYFFLFLNFINLFLVEVIKPKQWDTPTPEKQFAGMGDEHAL
jgi:hypothetical protein